VDDLYQLSLADSGGLIYQKDDLDLGILLQDAVRFFQPQFNAKAINVSVKVPDGSNVFVHADQERLHQLISNLLKNSLAYTDSDGRLEVSLTTIDDNAIIEFQDTKPSVSEKDLDRLFERLYRAEGSRNRASGGSGLGLSISKTIVEAHEGTISAHHSPLGGLLIRITLPVAGKTA
jgi:two-component system, OmpR family, sensor histidine kinase BaeS